MGKIWEGLDFRVTALSAGANPTEMIKEEIAKRKLTEQKWDQRHTDAFVAVLDGIAKKGNTWEALENFINFLEIYEEDVKAGNVKRVESLTGRFEYEQTVSSMEWDRIRDLVKTARECFELDPPEDE